MAKQKLTFKNNSFNYEANIVAPDFSAEDYIEMLNNNHETDKQTDKNRNKHYSFNCEIMGYAY